MEELTPFEAAQERVTYLAESLSRAHAVNELVKTLMVEERGCTLPVSGSNIEVHYETAEAQDATKVLNLMAAIDAAIGISA